MAGSMPQESTSDIIQHAAVAGELAKNLWGRTDFTKYDNALARGQNWTVDFRGGMYSRAGFEFVDVIQWSLDEYFVLAPFQYSPDTANTYLCLFTDSKVRFVQDGAYVLEAAKTIASVANGAADKIVITSTAHGYADGDWVKLAGFTDATLTFLNTRTVEVANKTTNTFDIKDVITGALITKVSINTDTGSAYRIYTVVSPYDSTALADLQIKQIRDYLRLTHPDYPIKNLIRSAHTSWAVSNETIGNSVSRPSGTFTVTNSAAGTYGYVYHFTCVDAEGNESLPTIVATVTSEDLNTADTYNSFVWPAVSGVEYYKIYRSTTIGVGTKISPDLQAGYIGSTVGALFTDPGITPDFSSQAPVAKNPFANGSILSAYVSTQGTGYDYTSTITWPADGSGAYGFLVVMGLTSGPITGVRVLDGGADYTDTTITAADGSSAVIAATLSPASGNYPRTCAVFEQRLVYAATDNHPLRLYGSRPGLFSNMSGSLIAADSDAYQLDIDSEEVAPIRHLQTVQGGILAYQQTGLWLLFGRSDNAIVPNTVIARPQSALGSSYVPPIIANGSPCYVSDNGQTLQLLTYDNYNRVYVGQNLSLIANHLFSPDVSVRTLVYADTPHQLIYAVQENGRLITIAVDQPNSVYAATPHWTKGKFRAAQALLEGHDNRIYAAVHRAVNGNDCLFLERQDTRRFSILDDAFCVDAGLRSAKTTPNGILTPSSFTGAVTFTVTGATPFAVGDVGKVIRCGSGKATITGYTSTTVVTGTWTRDLVETAPESTVPRSFLATEWYMDTTLTTLEGAWHLIGEDVSILQDGVAATGTIDAYGGIALTGSPTRVALGLSYTCIAQTLPLTVSNTTIEGRRKDNVGVGLRIDEAYGLQCGATLTKLHTIADRANRLWSTSARLRSEMIYEFINSDWNRDGQIYFVQASPLPATILSFIRDIEVGDDKS